MQGPTRIHSISKVPGMARCARNENATTIPMHALVNPSKESSHLDKQKRKRKKKDKKIEARNTKAGKLDRHP